MKRKFSTIGLIATFLASGLLHYWHAPALVQFAVSSVAILFAAGLLSKATENVAHYSGERIGGFLNATFGNATELILSIILIRDAIFGGKPQLFDMVKASITGSIIGNLLLVLGLSILFGGFKFRTQRFNLLMADYNASLMILSVIAFFVPAMFAYALTDHVMNRLSIIVAILLILVYILWLFFSMVSHRTELNDEGKTVTPSHMNETNNKAKEAAVWSKKTSILCLLLLPLWSVS